MNDGILQYVVSCSKGKSDWSSVRYPGFATTWVLQGNLMGGPLPVIGYLGSHVL